MTNTIPRQASSIFHPQHSWQRTIRAGFFLLLISTSTVGVVSGAEDTSSQTRIDYTKGPEWFPRVFKPYRPLQVPDPSLANAPSVSQSIQGGKLKLSLSQLKAAATENNLDIASAYYGKLFADTDVLRAKGGGALRGAPGVQIPSGLFAGAIGAGVGDTGGLGGSGSAGGITGGARAVTVRARGSFDPSFIMNFSLDSTTSPLNTVRVSGVPTVGTKTTALQTRYSQAFTTGTSMSISFNNQRQSSTQQFLLYNPAFISTFSFSATQQLLNSRSKAVNRRFIDAAMNGRKIANEAFRQQVATTLALALNTYWDLVAARENVAATEKALGAARQLYEDNRKREEIGVLSQMEVITAQGEVASRQRDVVVAQTTRQMREADLKNILSKEMDAALASAEIEPADPLPEPKDSDIPVLANAMATATINRPELRQAEGNMLIQDIARKFAKDLLRPTLTLFAFFGSSGLNGDRVIPDPTGGPSIVLPGGISQAFRNVFAAAYPEYAVGFSFSLPLRNRSAQADDIRIRLERRQAETDLESTRSSTALEVRKAVIGLVQAKAQVESARKTVSLNQQILSAEQIKLQEGVSTPYDVILRERDLLTSQFAEIQARADYAKALVEIKRSMGILDKE